MTASYSHILRQGADIADEREKDYGDAQVNFERTSEICRVAFGIRLSAKEIQQVMVAVKLSRNLNKPKADNLLDAIDYLAMQIPSIEQ